MKGFSKVEKWWYIQSQDNCPLDYLQFDLFGTKLFLHKSTNQAIVHIHSKSYSIEKQFVHASLSIS